jgi:phosphatidylglycerophosphatase C
MSRPAPTSLRIMAATAMRKARLVTRPTLMNIALDSLKGKTRVEVESIGRAIFEKTILPNINQLGILEMKKKHEEGYEIIVLSGAFDFILKPFCESYGIDHWHSTQIAYLDNVCSGRLEGIEFLGEAKRIYLQNRFSSNKINWNESCAYSDELTDIPLFSMVGCKFLIVGDSGSQISLPQDIQCVRW